MQKNEILKQYKNKELTRQDNDFLFNLYNQMLINGEDTKEIRELLILGNRKIVYDILIKKGLGMSDELVSTAMMGLIKAVDSFNISKKFTFSTYAYKVISNELFYEHRKVKKHEGVKFFSEEFEVGKDTAPIESTFESEQDNPEVFIDILENKDKMKSLMNAIKFLNEKEKEILFLVYDFETGDIKRHEEVAKIIKKSRSYVSKLLTSAKKKLQLILSDYNSLSDIDKYLYDQILGCKHGKVDMSKQPNRRLIQTIIEKKLLMSGRVESIN